jgi:signal transduction histidine kinase
MKVRASIVFIFSLIFLITIYQTNVISQVKESFETVLTSVQAGSDFIPGNEWNNLKIKKGLPVKFSFSSNETIKKKIRYRIFFDGNMLETNLDSTEYSFTNLETGVHILRIIPVTTEGNIGKPLVLSFSVIEEVKKTQAPAEEESGATIALSPVIVYAAGGIIVFLIAVIVFLLLKKGNSAEETKEKNNALQELSEIKHSYRRMIDELKNQKEENEYLKKKIKELNTNIEMLEQVNVNLLKQKERLSESKRQLELLHIQKEELFAIAIHDIKNPAAAIQGYIQLLNSYDLNAHEQHEIILSLASSSENIVKLSQNMCEIIAKSMPEPKIGLVSSSLTNIINDVCNQNMSYAKTKKVKLLNKSSRDIPEIQIDAEKIQEALDNFINNAIKYAPPETTVEVKSYVKQGEKRSVVVEVTDNGVGLSETDAEKCFQKGMILSSVPTGLEQSSGLGLWIVKRIIEDHKGKVWVNSKLGAGSTFGLEIPL